MQLLTRTIVFAGLFLVFVLVGTTTAAAQDYVVLDGLGGIKGQWMRGEVNRLESLGHNVTYRPWWRWRNAVRTTGDRPVNVIGYSLGGGRAVMAAQQLNVTQLELVDPFLGRGRSIVVPNQIPTTVFRATESRFIQSSPVIGATQTYYFPTSHGQIPNWFRN